MDEFGGGYRLERAFCGNWSVCHNANLWQIPQNRKMVFLRCHLAAICACYFALGSAAETRAAEGWGRQSPPNQGHSLLTHARLALAGHKTISAKIHQRIHLYGQELVGSGILVQGPPEKNLLQLDLTIKVDEQTSYVQQRCDGDYFWLQKFVDGVPVLTRIDVKRVEAARAALKGGAAGTAVTNRIANKPSLPTFGLGGIGYLIDQLDEWCVFSRVAETKLPGPDGLPVWALEGTWRRERLLVWLPEQKAAADKAGKAGKGGPLKLGKLPTMVPDRIVVFLGRDDLFPRRIEYSVSESRRFHEGAAPPLVRIHFDEVQFDQSVDPRQFLFNSAVVPPIDDTEGYLLRQGWAGPVERR